MHEFFDPDQVFRIVDIAAVVANGLLGGAVRAPSDSTLWASCCSPLPAVWAAA